MKKYLLSFQLALLDILEYRVDNLMRLIRYSALISFVMFLWLAVKKENPDLSLDISQIITYYVAAAIMYGLSNYHLDYVESDIRLGYISKFMLKPLSPHLYYMGVEAATAFFDICVRVFFLIPLVWLLGYAYHPSFLQVLLAVAFLPIIFYTTFTLYFSLSLLGFWFIQVDSIRMSALFLIRFTSGMMIPIIFFPEWFQKLLYYSPAPHFAFTPIRLLQGELSLTLGLHALGILSIWAIIITLLQKWMWYQASRNYESTGI
ncbi:MAG TPA: ABC-2 family transporter protein [Patescibacteria group bacterium]